MKKVLILGAGISGLVAAVHLVRAGFRVKILEKRPYAGGRAYSFRKNFWPGPIDNGPHVMLGAYTRLLEYLKLVGAGERLHRPERFHIPFFAADGQRAALREAELPAPLHLGAGLWRFGLLGGRDRAGILRAFLKVRFAGENPALDSLTAEAWLRRLGQTQRSNAVFWRPLVLATLNAEPEEVSALQLCRVLRLGFLAGREKSRLITLPEGLTATLIDPGVRWLQSRGVEFCFRCGVRKMRSEKDRIVAVETAAEEIRDFEIVLSALPPHVLRQVVPRDSSFAEQARGWQFQTQPILNLHFWLPLPLLREEYAALLGTTGQWLFRQGEANGLVHHAVVVSGGKKWLAEDRAAVVQRLFRELQELFPGFDVHQVVRHYLVIEKHATVLCSPGAERRRPLPGPLRGNLFLAGDWTHTGLPPTLESAARSGAMAAQAIMSAHP